VASLKKCQELSPLWWSFEIEGLLFIGVCSSLWEPYDGADLDEICRLQDEQERFVALTLQTNPEKNWVLCTHSPDIRGLMEVISPYWSTLDGIMFGDKHSPLGGLIEKIEKGRLAIFCPSSAPLWWRGGGYLFGTVTEGYLQIQAYRLKFSRVLRSQIRQLPFSSFWKCVWWLFRCKLKNKV
jgi:hypothetical protein